VEKVKSKLPVYLVLLASIVLVLPTVSQAGHFSGGFSSGHLTYGLGSGSSSSISSTAASQWNGVSSNVSLTYTSASNLYGSTADIVTHFDNTSPPTSGALGRTYPYKSWTGTSGSLGGTTDTWVKAIVYQYTNSSLNTTTKKTHTATHELGHALSVAHPSSTSTNAVMQKGALTFYDLRTYDKDSLKDKWGN
jgi:hypothetical protein